MVSTGNRHLPPRASRVAAVVLFASLVQNMPLDLWNDLLWAGSRIPQLQQAVTWRPQPASVRAFEGKGKRRPRARRALSCGVARVPQNHVGLECAGPLPQFTGEGMEDHKDSGTRSKSLSRGAAMPSGPRPAG